jgi:hypothetical protein
MGDSMSVPSNGPAETPLPPVGRRFEGKRRRSRRVKLALVAGGFFTLAGLIAGVLWLLRPPAQASIALVGAGPGDDLALPADAYGWSGLDALRGLTDEGGSGSLASSLWSRKLRLHNPPTAAVLKTPGVWDEGLGGLGDERTAIFYVDLNGGADEEGAYLLAADSKRLRLEKLLDSLRNLPGRQDRNKVLILDATKVGAYWPLALHNDFARALRRLDGRVAEDKHLLVISATDVDQRSWVSDEWQKSIFAQKVLEGLGGAADRDGHKRITALELYDYVHDEVKHWARTNRAARQTPVLLPSGDEGRKRADDMQLTTIDHAYQPPDSKAAPGAGKAPPAWLEEHWRTHDKLMAGNPPPAACSPHLWSRYQEGLLRCEELVRAGQVDAAEKLAKETLGELESNIEEARKLDLVSSGNSLAMFRAFGAAAAEPDAEAIAHFRKAWDAEEKALEDRRRGGAAEDKTLDEKRRELRDWARAKGARPALCGWLLDKVSKAGPAEVRDSLRTARALYHAAFGAGNERPTEILYLALLDRDLPDKPPPGKLLQRALALRRQAEEAAVGAGASERGELALPPYSEHVYRWVGGKVELADQHRRLGEDRLFASDEAAWKEAEDHFAKAEALYAAAAASAAVVRRALWSCDEAYSALPYYSRWAARSGGEVHKDLEGRIIQLWEIAHVLDGRLRLQKPDSTLLDKGDQEGLKEPGAQLLEGLRQLGETFRGDCTTLAQQPAGSRQDNWRKINDALAVPFIATDTRQTLLSRLHTIAGDLNAESMRGERGAEPPSQEETSEKARQAAVREGRMAVAALGHSRLEKGEQERILDLLERRDEWDKAILKAGAAVAISRQKMPNDLKERVEEARKPGSADTALDSLARAGLLCRQVDGGLVPAAAGNPVADERRLRLHDFFLWQARRTLLDHWWGEEPKAKAYYEVAGGNYVRDADTLLARDNSPAAESRKAERQRAQRALSEPFTLALRWNDPERGEEGSDGAGRRAVVLHVTGDPEIDLRYRLQADLPLPTPSAGEDRAMPVGVPVVWVDAGDMKNAGDFKKEGDDTFARLLKRQGYKLTRAKEGPSMGTDLPAVPLKNPHKLHLLTQPDDDRLAGQKPIDTPLALRGLYRGLELELPTKLVVHPAADSVVYQHPGPAAAGVAVIKKLEARNRPGTMVIVVDYSLSMAENRFGAGSRKDAAVEALDRVLADVPEGTIVSVLVFGQEQNVENPGVAFGTEEMVQKLRPAQPWQREQRADLVARAKKLTPKWGTPLVRSMWAAKKVFDAAGVRFPDEAKAGKTLLVLTDGDDSTFPRDTDLHRLHGTSNIPKFLQAEFGEEDIAINLVLFEATKEERENALNHFKGIDKFKTPGEIYPEESKSTDELVRKLRDALGLKLSYRAQRDGAVQYALNAPRQRDLDVLDIPTWYYLSPGPYDLGTKALGKKKQAISLKAAEGLLLKLTPDGFRRALLKDLERFKGCDSATDEGKSWRLTLLDNQLRINHQQLLLATLEKLNADEDVDTLEQIPPREAWFEVRGPQGKAAPNGFCWGNYAGSLAPTWDLRLPQMDSDSVQEVSVWVSRNKAPDSDWWPDPNKPPTLGELRPQLVTLEGKKVKVHVSVEQLRVVNGAGVEENQHCLVVRAPYAAGRPVFARLPGLDPTKDGYEHHYFTHGDSGHYTGVFWFGQLPREDVAKKAARLSLVSVEELKNDPATRRITLKKGDNLKAPVVANERPTDLQILNNLRKYAGEK